MKVLVVDDEQIIREEIASWMRYMGWEADECFDGYVAIGMLQKKEYDLIITDLMMAGMSGMKLIDYIKTKYDTPYLVMTCWARERVDAYNFPFVWFKDGMEKFDEILNRMIEG